MLRYLTLGLDQCPYPIFILNSDINVFHANPAGHTLLRGPVLRLQEECLVTSRRAENTTMQAAFRGASDHASVVRLCDRQGRGVLILSIQLLLLSAGHSVVIVRAIDLRAPPVIGQADISRLFGLSPAEGRVASSLLAGNDAALIAEALKISTETVRTHLKQAMTKTGTHSQAQLIGMLLRGTQAIISPQI